MSVQNPLPKFLKILLFSKFLAFNLKSKKPFPLIPSRYYVTESTTCFRQLLKFESILILILSSPFVLSNATIWVKVIFNISKDNEIKFRNVNSNCLPATTSLYVYPATLIWRGIATSHLSATVCGWPLPLLFVFSVSVWHLHTTAMIGTTAMIRTTASLCPPYYSTCLDVCASKVRLQLLTFLLFFP